CLWNHPQAALHGRELAQTVMLVLREQGPLAAPDTGANALSFAAHDDDHRRAEFRKEADQAIEKGFAAELEQSLGRSHARGFAGCQNQSGGAHLTSARSDSSAKMDMERARQLDAGPRRTAIISAATAMAISSGEMAPISRPIGA